MRELYPELECYESHSLIVDKLHKVYLEECGNPSGLPVIFLHGGPGSGCNENHRRYFNPDKYRIILFDQRGCNRSTPQGCIEQNSTPDLIQDMEQIRKQLNIDRWFIFGGSWGATLGLLYAETYPDRISGLILRGTFLARQKDIEWFVKDGARRIFPDYWQEFMDVIPEMERDDVIRACHKRVFGKDKNERIKFAKAWSNWATRTVTWNLDEIKNEEEDISIILNEVFIETHYAINRYFIEENQILNHINRLPKVPTFIIHGRRDMTCTLDASWDLHRAILHSEFIIVSGTGHLAGEPLMTDALVTATDKMADLLA